MFIVAHVSDTHLDGGQHSAERAERVMSYIGSLRYPIDAVLVTGDIAEHGSVAEYEEARKVLVGPYPIVMCPGNHDERGAYRRVLLGDGTLSPDGDAPINEAHRIEGVTIAMCDSSIPGEHSGFLTDGTLEWLDDVLSTAPGDALVCFHHPPVSLHSPFVDAIRQHGERRLDAVLRRHDNVVAVLCGHAHTAAATTFAGLPLLMAPGVASTLRLPWEYGDDLDDDAPPAIAFHVLGDDHRLTTHYRVIV